MAKPLLPGELWERILPEPVVGPIASNLFLDGEKANVRQQVFSMADSGTQ